MTGPAFHWRALGRPARRVLVIGASMALVVGVVMPVAAAKPASKTSTSGVSTVALHRIGTARIRGTSATSTASGIAAPDLRPDADSAAAAVDKNIPNSLSYARVPSSHVPRPATSAVVDASGVTSFPGLNHADQHSAGSGTYAGTQFSLEPPDQALCVGSGYVVESVNTAIRVRSTSGAVLGGGAEPLNEFFGLAPEYVSNADGSRTYGPFTSDPKCYYDSPTGRFFVSLLEIGVDPATGNFTPHAYQLLAVSETSNPLGSWYLYEFETTDGDGSTPGHPNCPCFGDQPLIGADANGFYVTTNEFPIFAAGFNGAQVYAMDKAGLESGTLPTVVHINAPDQAEGPAYSLQPTTTPPGGSYALNTEYFLSALDFNGTLDNRITLWALTGTDTLADATPSVDLQHVVLNSEVYGQPPAMTQKNGPTPLGDLLNAPKNPLTGHPMGEHLNLLNSNDDRMNQTVYADGMVWGAVNTVVKSPTGPTRTGIAYFIVSPSWSTGGSLDGQIAKQGYVAVQNNNVVFPAIAANKDGRGVMSFTLVGPDYYPSLAYVNVSASSGAGAVHLVAAGQGPSDGFTGYLTFDPGDGGVARWGDYGAAVAGSDGSIWMAAETINQSCTFGEFLQDTTCGGTRSLYANWGTYIANVNP